MGSPMFGLVLLYKMRRLEEKNLNNIQPWPDIWLRYVDEIFFTWEFGRHAHLNFFREINEIDNNIKFTQELENNVTLPFLDILLMKDNNILKRKVYRKRLKIDSVITFNATTPCNSKIAVLNSFVNRLCLRCSKEYIREEHNNIICLAKEHGFRHNNIHSIIQKYRITHKYTQLTYMEIQ